MGAEINLPDFFFSSYPGDVAKRAAVRWVPGGECPECGARQMIGFLDGVRRFRACTEKPHASDTELIPDANHQ